MTNGEVYALLRRRRDERNAARHPPFGLQPVPTDAQQRAAAPHGFTGVGTVTGSLPSAAGAAVVSAAAPRSAHGQSGVNFSSSSSMSRAVPAGAIESASAAAAASTASILAAPSSVHLVVLLTEVTMLNYIANHASLTREPPAAVGHTRAPGPTLTPRDVYGPTSVYDRVVGNAPASPTSAAGARIDAELLASCHARLSAHRPGTRGHVAAVEELLDHLEDVGRAQERFYAAGLRRAVQRLWQQRLWVPAGSGASPLSPPTARAAAGAAGWSAVKAEPDADAEAVAECDATGASPGGAAAATATAAARKKDGGTGAPRPSMSRALAPLLMEPTPLWGLRGGGLDANAASAAGTAAAAGPTGDAAGAVGNGSFAKAAAVASTYRARAQQEQQRRTLLSEAEVLQLVVGRPQRALDVYRLLDDIDGRLRYSEAAISAFVESVTAVFVE